MWKKFFAFFGFLSIFKRNRNINDEPLISTADNEPVLSGTLIVPPVLSATLIEKPEPLMVPFTTDIEYLDPSMAIEIPTFLEMVEEKGIRIKITCTARLYKCQVALYAQGRQPIEEVNRLRALAGMRSVYASEASNKVTWTLVSTHLVNFDDTDADNDYSLAFDFVVMERAKAIWDPKVDVNENLIPDYEEVGKIAESFGWTWGGRWRNKDLPHVQKKRI